MAYRSGSIIILIIFDRSALFRKTSSSNPSISYKKIRKRLISLPKIGTQLNPLRKNLSMAYRSGSIIIIYNF